MFFRESPAEAKKRRLHISRPSYLEVSVGALDSHCVGLGFL